VSTLARRAIGCSRSSCSAECSYISGWAWTTPGVSASASTGPISVHLRELECAGGLEVELGPLVRRFQGGGAAAENERGGNGERAFKYAKTCRDPRQTSDLLVIASDANCSTFVKKRNEIQKRLKDYPGPIALALPDPHIEHWLLLDPRAFQQGVDIAQGIELPQYKCDKNYYKTELNRLLQSEGIVPQFPGGIEFAPDIIKHLNMPLACKDTSFKEFFTAVRTCLRDM